MQSGIYEIRNKLNNKVYIGSAKNFDKRWKRHLSGLRNNNHPNIKLQRSFNKHGEYNFEFNIIEIISYEKDIIIEKENYYIKKFNSKENGYNIADASFGDTLTFNPNRDLIIEKITNTINNNISNMTLDERKEKFGRKGESNGMYGKTHTEEVKKFLSEVNIGNQNAKGRIVTEEQRKKLSDIASKRTGENNPFYGKTHTEETKKKIAEKNIGIKPVNCVSITIDDITYESYTEASRVLNIKLGTIIHRCKSENVKFKNYFINA